MLRKINEIISRNKLLTHKFHQTDDDAREYSPLLINGKNNF